MPPSSTAMRHSHHPWSSSNVENEVDIMPVDREQYNTRGTTVDKHFMRRKLVEKRKEEWKVMLQSDKKKAQPVPASINYRANAKNNVKRQVVAATAQRLSDNSHAAIRAMRSNRLSDAAKNNQTVPEAKSQSAREMRLARLKQSTSTASNGSPPLTIPHKKTVKATTVPFEAIDSRIDSQAAVTSSIREMRLAQGKAPVAKSYTSSTAVLRVPKTTTPKTKSVRRPSLFVTTKQNPIRTPNPPRNQKDDTSNDGGGCNFIHMKDLMSHGGRACHGFQQSSADNTSTTSSLSEDAADGKCHLVLPKDVMGSGCNATKMTESMNIGCDLSMLQDWNVNSIATFLGCSGGNQQQDESAELVSRGSSEEDSAVYVKKYGYEY